MTEISDGVIKRMRNLKLYRDKTDDEIREMMTEKALKDTMIPKTPKVDRSYEAKFKDKLDMLKNEFAVDMNDANDREMLSSLVRHMMQSEAADEAIRAVYERGGLDAEDFRNLKNLGDMQRSISQTIADLQDKLGISRKLRKEKQTDDIPQWIDGVLERAKTMFDRQTTKIECPKCKIELVRVWINFPVVEATDARTKNTTILAHSLEAKFPCWKCHEYTLYTI